jgi:hypothetical protein
MARIAVVALVVLVLCIYLLANAQEFEGPAISHKLSLSQLRTSVSLPLSAAASTASSTISPVVSVIATIVVGHVG